MIHIILITSTFRQYILNHFESVFYGISACMGIFICYCYFGLKKHGSKKTTPPVATGQIAAVLTAGLTVGQTIVINGNLMKVVKSKNQITAQPNENTTVSQSKEGAAVKPTKRHTLGSNWSFA